MTVYLLVEIDMNEGPGLHTETVDAVFSTQEKAEHRMRELAETMDAMGVDNIEFRIDEEKVQ